MFRPETSLELADLVSNQVIRHGQAVQQKPELVNRCHEPCRPSTVSGSLCRAAYQCTPEGSSGGTLATGACHDIPTGSGTISTAAISYYTNTYD